MAISPDDLLPILRDEKRRAMGFDGDDDTGELQSARTASLLYYKGDMSTDIPSLENRSSAVSSDVADAIEQVLPQLVEIFLEEEVCSFVPSNENDIAAAEQETDYVNYVVFKENDGFNLLLTAFKDALLLKTGIFMWQWEPGKDEEQVFEDLNELDFVNLIQSIADDQTMEIVEVEQTLKIEEKVAVSGQDSGSTGYADDEQSEPSDNPAEDAQEGDPQAPPGMPQGQTQESTYTVTLRKKKEGKVKINAWAPDDVGVSEDTVKLGDGTYCGFRSRVRRQDLLDDGYDADKVMDLPAYGGFLGEAVNVARDMVGEELERVIGSSTSDPHMDTVEVLHNFIRVYEDGDDKCCLYRVVTGGNQMETVLDFEEISRVPASSVCPFPNPHRFYGESLADKLMEVQRVNTALLRMGLDSGYYAMNQRLEVAESGVTKHTLSDILNNVPGAPIRTKQIGSVAPVSAGQMNFPFLDMMEFMKTTAEQRSGVMRSTMGLTPDTLHDTKGGMLAMMNMGQIRIRFIARIFAETGVKDMFLGVHELLRENATMEQTVRLRGKFVPVNPSRWALRENMVVEIGNAGGREYDLQALQQILTMQQNAVELQGGQLNGPAVTVRNMLTTANKMVSRMGFRNPEVFFQDPAQGEQQYQQMQQQQQGQQQVDPEVQKAQLQMQLQQQKAQSDFQLAQAKHQSDIQIQQQEMQSKANIAAAQAQKDFELKQMQVQLDHQAKLRQMEAELALKEKQMQAELNLKYEVERAQAQLKQQEIMQKGLSETPNINGGVDLPHPGGDAAS